MQKVKKLFIVFLQKVKCLSALAPFLVKLTGKHKEKIHPKHLIKLEEKEWYEPWITKDDKVLDVGCGNGQRAIKIAKIAKSVVGFDFDKESIRLAINEKKSLNIKNVKFFQGNAEKKFKFKKNSFDAVFFCDVIEHLNNDKGALEEINRVLKKKGVLLLIAPNSQTSWKMMQKNAGLFYFSDPGHKREYTKNEILNLLSKTGFKVLSVGTVVYDTPLSGIIDIIGGFSLTAYKKLSLWKLNYASSHPLQSNGFRIVAKKL